MNLASSSRDMVSELLLPSMAKAKVFLRDDLVFLVFSPVVLDEATHRLEIRFHVGKGLDFSKESVERSWGKNRLMKAVRSSSHVLIVPSLSSSNHVFASPVSDRGNIIRQTTSFFGVSVFKHITYSEEFMNVFVRIGFGSTIELVSFDES
nr:hypothetical protein [Tanacetum cinerariifolium]